MCIRDSKDSAAIMPCEAFNTQEKRWIEFGRLNCPRVQAAACSIKETAVYVFGGVRDGTETWPIECMELGGKEWKVVECEVKCASPERVWCTQIGEQEIIVFDKKSTAIFHVSNTTMEEENTDSSARYIPDKRGEIKKYGDDVVMILESSGNVGLYSLTERKWKLRPHIMLGLYT
eukprot:TRINITY_DN10798_c0_g1_i5.p2 TRINITY_DN10798_c0_g1~~TRINITY_DN10798_c0_g1_i5.p2  ORF type:complete len:175 (+),score=36.33 TRINITY_DN10798_c0_g1_i5:73-597(+)